jgi:tetratricopeptide (TPR) repeat protein
LRALLLSYVNRGCGFLLDGDFQAAASEFKRGSELPVDPMYVMYARLMYGVTLASAGQLAEAEEILVGVVEYDQNTGFNLLGTTARGMMSVVLLSRGQLAEGVAQAQEVLESYRDHENWFRYAHQHHMLGSFYLRLVLREGPKSLGYIAKNAAFLIKNVRHARGKAASHFNKAIETAASIGAKGVLAQSYLDLGRLQASSGERNLAADSFEKAYDIFEKTGAEQFLAKCTVEIECLEPLKKAASTGH